VWGGQFDMVKCPEFEEQWKNRHDIWKRQAASRQAYSSPSRPEKEHRGEDYGVYGVAHGDSDSWPVVVQPLSTLAWFNLFIVQRSNN